MCTLVLAARVVPGAPLVVVANRDEQLGRPSSPPSRWPGGFIAPRDEVAGGTWLGYSDHGVFVGITNRYLGPRDVTRRSRGALVAEALAEPSARAIHEVMSRVDPARYNGFHLVYADDRDVLATVSDGSVLAQLTLGDGVTLVTERSFGAAGAEPSGDARRAARIRSAWRRLVHEGAAVDARRVTTLLAEHDDVNRLGATCIHLDELGYGTRSAMVLAAGGIGVAPTMLWAEGPPCVTPFREIDVATATVLDRRA